MLYDFLIFKHRELCQQEMMDEAREFAKEYQLTVDWNFISSLINEDRFVECFLYTQGFFDHNLLHDENPSLSFVYETLKDFLFEENL
jgi:hypothetical protein